jgi:hypothetical protein
VTLDGLGGDEQGLGDLRVGRAAGGQLDDPLFAWREVTIQVPIQWR